MARLPKISLHKLILNRIKKGSCPTEFLNDLKSLRKAKVPEDHDEIIATISNVAGAHCEELKSMVASTTEKLLAEKRREEEIAAKKKE